MDAEGEFAVCYVLRCALRSMHRMESGDEEKGICYKTSNWIYLG